MSKIPERLINYAVHDVNGKYLGMVDAVLPNFEALTETITGAGILGEYESTSTGHFGSQQIELNFRELTESIIRLYPAGTHEIILKAVNQSHNIESGKKEKRQLYVSVGAEFKSGTSGTMAVNAEMGTGTTLEVSRITIKDGGNEILNFNKFTYTYSVNGVDQLSEDRDILGI